MILSRCKFRLSALFFLTTAVGVLIWWLSPSPQDRRAEENLLGKWEIRLTEKRNSTTQTSFIQWSSRNNIRVFASRVANDWWYVRDGILTSGVRARAPGLSGTNETKFKLTWLDQDNFIATTRNLSGEEVNVYYRRLAPQPEKRAW